MPPVIEGIFIGFGTAFIIGPVFFTLLKNSLEGNKINGVLTALGILTSDLLAAMFCLYFSREFLINYVNQTSFKIVGCIILFVFGISFYFKPHNFTRDEGNNTNSIRPFFQGFSINFINPSVFVIWIGFIALANQRFNTSFEIHSFIIGILIGIFSTDLIKVFGASIIAKKLSPHWMNRLFKLMGIFLILAAIFVGYQVVL